MRHARTIAAEIEKLASRRQAIWFGDAVGAPTEVRSLTAKLADLFEERRIEDARGRTGDRTEIARRARIETELERLMS